MITFANPVQITQLGKICGTGWIPPRPDLRDYTEGSPELIELMKKLRLPDPTAQLKLPAQVDLRSYCSPIENQGRLGACTAHAAVGMVEYFERRARRRHIDGSRRFVYKVTRNLMRTSGDTGAWMRNAMGALTICGIPPEKYWPYTEEEKDFDLEPSAFVYSVADKFEALKYFCHDPFKRNIPPDQVLISVKKFLAAGVPAMFGFYGFASFEKTNVVGGIPFPAADEQSEWGHAVLAVGYDDKFKITHQISQQTTVGALLLRNSWGKEWGEQGYGWLPYDYVLNRLALDFWSLLSMRWVDTQQFGL